MGKIVLCSTLHDPDGVLPVQGCKKFFEYVRNEYNVGSWNVTFTEPTYKENGSNRTVNGFGEIGAKGYGFSGLDSFDNIAGNHIYALEKGLKKASGDDVLVYCDGDRLILAMTYFHGDLLNFLADVHYKMKHFDYISVARTDDAFRTHTKPMLMTESVIDGCLSKLLEIRLIDPGSTTHAFKPEMVRYILDRSAKEGVHSYPHINWTLFANEKLKEGKRPLVIGNTGGMLSYETVLFLEQEMIKRLAEMEENFNPESMKSEVGPRKYNLLRDAFEETGLKEETERNEWPHRYKVAGEWIQIGQKLSKESDPNVDKIVEMFSEKPDDPKGKATEIYQAARELGLTSFEPLGLEAGFQD